AKASTSPASTRAASAASWSSALKDGPPWGGRRLPRRGCMVSAFGRGGRRVQPDNQAGIFQPGGATMFKALDLFFFLAVGAVSLFTFIGIAVWITARKQERLALYRSEVLKKLAEQSGEGGRQVLAIMHEESAGKEREKRRGIILGGLICAAVGMGLI